MRVRVPLIGGVVNPEARAATIKLVSRFEHDLDPEDARLEIQARPGGSPPPVMAGDELPGSGSDGRSTRARVRG